jgi:hypothetical protein
MTRSDNDSPPEGAAEVSHERAGPRSRLPIPVRVKIGLGPSRDTQLRDVSVSGIRIDWPDPTDAGDAAIVRFEGYPGVCPAFILHGRVARLVTGRSPGLGIAIDREGSSAETLQHFRLLVLHYLRHKPLLDQLERDFFEGRCEACDWIGRVGARSPVCPRCGRRVRALDPDQ